MDYNSVEKLYVINSTTTELGSSVTITKTSDMDQLMDSTTVVASSVVITDNQGIEHPLALDNSGSYSSQSLRATSVGESFTLVVEIGDDTFVSQSSVEPKMEILSMEIVEESLMGEMVLLADLELSRNLEQVRYYKYDLFVDGHKVVWGTGDKDIEAPNPFTISIIFAVEGDDGELITTDDDELPVAKGCEIEVKLTALDKRGYDYFNTLSLSSSTNSNPVDNFSGGCLGYYTAYLTNTTSLVWE